MKNEAPEEDVHFTVTTDWISSLHSVRFSTKREALAAATAIRQDFPRDIVQVCIVRYGQECALGIAEWATFPGTADARAHDTEHTP